MAGDVRGGAPLTDATLAQAPLWLLRHRIAVPARLSGFYERSGLAERCRPPAHRLTLLVAPGGFGKTSLLAECCRPLLDDGVRVAWLTLDGGDEPGVADIYLAHALQVAGLDVEEAIRAGDADTNHAYPRTALLLRLVEASGDPVVLALDEAEQLNTPLAELVSYLVHAAPPNLHIAIAGRELPDGLDIAAPVLGGDGAILTSDDLRFSREDIAGFFNHRLSGDKLEEVASMSGGWPIALRIRQNEPVGGLASERVVRDVVENWVDTRFWYSFTDDEREFLSDVGLFEWIDAELIDEVLGTTGSWARLEAMRGLDGLLKPATTGAEAPVLQLHPLIRDHCAARRRRETPERYRHVHAEIARALARRSQTVLAMRHALQAADERLLVTILLDAGGVWLWLHESPDVLVAADRLLGDGVVARHPRLVPVRCLALAAQGRLPEARRLLNEPIEPGSSDDEAFFADLVMAGAVVANYGGQSNMTDSQAAVLDRARQLCDRTESNPLLLYVLEQILCHFHGLHASFEEAAVHGGRVRQIAGTNPIAALTLDVQMGLTAMAQGRVRDAYALYRRGGRQARATILMNPLIPSTIDLLIRELDLERNRISAGTAASAPEHVRQGTQLAVHFAIADIAVERTLDRRGETDALSLLEDRYELALRDGLPALVRHLAALRVSLLARTGRLDEAQEAWTHGGLPETDAGCVDLTGQSWREAESVTAARVSLLTARGEFDAARQLGLAMLQVAGERGLRRTAMRMRVLGLKCEHVAGRQQAAVEHLVAFLDMFAETDYCRALVCESTAAKATLECFLSTCPDSPHQSTAESLLAAVGAASNATGLLSEREMQVLALLPTHRDRDIAQALGISRHGVRYHIGNVFRKLAVQTRLEAVRSARAAGILPPD